ncbi:MAG: signal peptidase II [Planctomycetes bacterium]|nr:signal peptidase II [Planctomycetota bacterium]
MLTPSQSRLLFVAIAIGGAFLDLATKSWAFRLLDGTGDWPIWPGVFHLNACMNRGVVWGLFQEGGPVFLVLAAVAVPVLGGVFLSLKPPTLASTLALASILAGTLGNLYDRIRFHAVRDFIDVRVIHWPVFNVADAFICVGAIGFAWILLTTPEKAPAPAPPPPGPAPADPAPADPAGR